MDNHIPSSPQPDTLPSTKFKLLIGLLPVVLLVLLAGIAIGRYVQQQEQQPAVPVTSDVVIQDASQVTKESSTDGNSQELQFRAYPSYSRQYTFYLYPASADSCWYGITEKSGIKLDFTRDIGTDTLPCTAEMGVIHSVFRGWGDGEKLVLELLPGEITILNINNREKSMYQYDNNQHVFQTVDRTLQYWLFRKKNQEADAYVILNANREVVLDNLPVGRSERGAHYDEVNNGFIFVDRTYQQSEQGENQVSVTFSFLPLDTLQLRQVVTTEPVVVYGMGCTSEYLVPTAGKIVMTRGCLTVPDSYLNDDGLIEINL